MAALEDLRRGIFPISSPPRERTAAPVLPKPEARLIPDPPLQPNKGRERKRISTKTRIALAGLALLEAGGAIANEQFNEQPISTQTVVQDLAWPWNLGKSAVEDIQRLFRNKAPSSEASVFDNSVSTGAIENTNSIIVNDVSVIKNIETVPSGPNVKHDINLLIPIKGLPTSGRIDYSKDFTGKNGNSPMFAEDIRQYAITNGVKDSIVFRNIPKDHIIVSPADGYIIFQRVRKNLPENVVDGVMIFYNAPDGTQQRISLGEESGKFLTSLIQTEFYTGSESQIDKIKLPIKRGQEILRTTENNNAINLFTHAIPSPSSQANYPDYPTNISLISSADPSTGQRKIVILGE